MLFPCLALKEPVTINSVLIKPISCSETGVFARLEGQNISRKIKALSANLVWAAYHAGEDITCGEFIKSNNDKPPPQTPLVKKSVNIDVLLAFMPKPDKPPQLAVYWFARYLQSDSEHKRVISLYNGLGSLPGGFGGIKGLFDAAGREALGQRLIDEVTRLRDENDETGPPVHKYGFNALDFKQIEDVFMKASKK